MAGTVHSWLLASGYSWFQSKRLSLKLLEKCVRDAEQHSARFVENLGDAMVRDSTFLKKRLTSGLTVDDVRSAWNDGFVWVRLQEESDNLMRMPAYTYLIKERGLTSEDAVKHLRKHMPYFGDPETSHKDFQGEDADLYFEFRARFDRWRDQFSSDQIEQLLAPFSSYNAMIRHYIRKKQI